MIDKIELMRYNYYVYRHETDDRIVNYPEIIERSSL